jgi:O-antigen/teichoic acid export membrane protein
VLKLFTGSAAIRVAGAATQLLLTLVISRLCGASEAGIFFFGFSILLIVSTLARLGSELSGLRVVARLYDSGNVAGLRSAVGTRLVVVVVVAVVASLMLLLSTPEIARHTFGSGASPVLFATASAIPAMSVIGLISEILKGARRIGLALVVQNVAVPVLAVPLILFASVFSELDAETVSRLLAFAVWAVALGGLGACLRVQRARIPSTPSTGFSISASEVLQVIRDAPFLLLVSMMPVLMQWIGATLLGFLAPASAVAGYSVAMRISIAVSIVHSAAAGVVGPQMSIAHAKEDLPQLQLLAQQTGLLIVFITWPALILMILFPDTCMSIFGHGYAGYIDVLRILLIGQMVAALIGHSGMVLVMTGRYPSARLASLVAGMSLVGLAVVTIPALGAEGAAIAMAGSVVLGHLAGILLVRRTLGIWTIPTSWGDLGELRKLSHASIPVASPQDAG